jgi:hypothetical protein
MDSKAQAVPAVEHVQVDLSEKGLTDLAAMLVKSGRMSSASFQEWAHRTSKVTGRWTRENKASKGAKSNKKSMTSKSGSGTKIGSEPSKKDKTKLAVLLKVVPACRLGQWAEVKDLRPKKAMELQNSISEVYETFTKAGMTAKEGLINLGLTEEEIKTSRSFFPYLPRFQNPANRRVLESAGVTPKGSDDEEDGSGIHPKVDDQGEGNLIKFGLTYASAVNAATAESAVDTPIKRGAGLFSMSGLEGGGGKAPPFWMLKAPPDDMEDIVMLTEHFRRYNWTSIPGETNLPSDFARRIRKAAKLFGTTNSRWKKMSINQKIGMLKGL